MLIDKLNLNHLRIFECVYRTRSMTVAARELHLTQSGVSQHMKTLEEALGIELFARIKQRLVPTAQANILYKQCNESLTRLERALSELQSNERELRGSVSVGIPIEFGNNVILPLLARFSQKHPRVSFDLRMGFAPIMSERLLSGDLDFAFIDGLSVDKRITVEPLYDEVLELCIHPSLLEKHGQPKSDLKSQRKYFEGLEYVEYQKEEPILRMWFAHHLKDRNLDLQVRATVTDAQGIARMVLAGMGAGILPLHLVSKLQKEGHQIHRFRGSGTPVKNVISLAYLKEREPTTASEELLTAIKAGLKERPDQQK